MKKRSLVALLLALAMVLAACGGGAKPASKPGETPGEGVAAPKTEGIAAELTVQAETAWMDYYKGAVERVVAKNPDAKIEIKEVGAFDHIDIITNTDASNADVADVFAIPADRLYSLSENEVLGAVNAEGLAEKLGGFDNFKDGLGGNFKVGDEYLAFPFNIETLIVFANKANAKAAGIDLAQPVELDKVKYNDVLIPMFDAWFGVAVTNSSHIELLGKKDDGKLFSDMIAAWAELAPEKQATITSIYNYWKANKEAGTPLFDEKAGLGYIDDSFKSGGPSSMRLDGPWGTASISEMANGGTDLEILPISAITVAGKPLNHWKGGWGLAINSRVEADEAKVQLAEALIAELVNPEHAVDLFKATGKVLENVKVETYTASDLSDVDKAVIKATIDSYNNSPARPLFTEWGKVWDTWKNAVLSWNSVNPESAEAAYSELKASFEAMMGNF